MKLVNVHGVRLQFDLEDELTKEEVEHIVQAQVEAMNIVLQEQFGWSQPQLFLDKEKVHTQIVTFAE